jgi:hypothetical protein
MGMYDKAPNFGEHFKDGDRFILGGAAYQGRIKTQYGEAECCILRIQTREEPKLVDYLALGQGIASQVKRAEPSDFPHVAEITRQPRPDGQTVKLLALVDVSTSEWVQGNDGPPLEAVGDTDF